MGSETERQKSTRFSRRNAWIMAALVCLIFLAAWVLTGSRFPANATSRARAAAAVGVARAAQADVPVTLNAIGTVQPVTTATVRTQESGVLFGIHFTEGQMVRKGQLLANIDPRPYQLALAQAEAGLARDTAQLAAARVDLNRYQTLLSQDSIARQQVDSQGAQVKQLEGTVAADRAAIGTAQLNLRYSAITAPVSGRIGLRQADLGNYVTPSDANGIAVITVTRPIDVAFTLPQNDIVAIWGKTDMAVAARDQNGERVIAEGRFLTLDNAVDLSTGTVRAKARFANEGDTLFPNQFVNVSFAANTLRHVVTVPVSAVRHGPNGDFLFLLQRDRTVRLRSVKTGPQTDSNIAILSGLAANETVVTEGADGLDDGSHVRLPGDRAPDRQGRRGARGRKH